MTAMTIKIEIGCITRTNKGRREEKVKAKRGTIIMIIIMDA
jgi:hypothetical protein